MHLKSKTTDLDSVASPPLLSSGGALEGGPRHDAFERVRYVLGHPVHLVCLGMLMLMGVFVASPWMLLPILMFEVLVAALAPRVKTIRQRADKKRRERRRQVASRARSGLVAYMEAIHGRELTELERRAAIARAHASAAGDAYEALLDDWYGVDRLLGAYVRLSIAHRTARESAALTDRERLCHEIRALERERDHASSPRLRRLMGRQLALLRSRAACLEKNEEEREALALELSSVASLCRLVHERTFALVSSPDLHNEVERLVSEMELQDQAIGEITSTAHEIDPLDEQIEKFEQMERVEAASARAAAVRVAVLESDDAEEEETEEGSRVLLRAGGMG